MLEPCRPGLDLVDKKAVLFDKKIRRYRVTQMERTWPRGNSSQNQYLIMARKNPAQFYTWFPLTSVLFHLLNVGVIGQFRKLLIFVYKNCRFIVKTTISGEWLEWWSFFKILVLDRITHVAYSLRGAVVSVVAFWAKGRGFKSTHGCSHTVQKPSISPRLFGQCTLNISLSFTITLSSC